MIQKKLLAIFALQIVLNFYGLTSGLVRTTSGKRCVFPFTYKGDLYWGCTTKNHHSPWCSTTANYDQDKKWGNCAGFSSVVKTTSGQYCVFPFTYRGVTYKSCTTKNHHSPWCSTTAIYAGKWGHCAGTYSNNVKTTSGKYCAFPFIYKGQSYTKCTTKAHTRFWCSLTTNYDKDKKWENCA